MNIQSIKYLAALEKSRILARPQKLVLSANLPLVCKLKNLKIEESQLLERTNKSVRLTEIGLLMAEHARNILQEMEAMREKAQAAKNPYSGQIKVGIIPTVAHTFFRLLSPKLSKYFP